MINSYRKVFIQIPFHQKGDITIILLFVDQVSTENLLYGMIQKMYFMHGVYL